jgi:hypothetical protein
VPIPLRMLHFKVRVLFGSMHPECAAQAARRAPDLWRPSAFCIPDRALNETGSQLLETSSQIRFALGSIGAGPAETPGSALDLTHEARVSDRTRAFRDKRKCGRGDRGA